MTCLCWIYKSPRFEEMYVYLNAEDAFHLMPEPLCSRLGQLIPVMSLDLDSKKKLAREDIQQVKANLQQAGFHLQLPNKFSPHLFYADH